MKKKSFIALSAMVISMAFMSSMNVKRQANTMQYSATCAVVGYNVENPIGKGISYGLGAGFGGAAGTFILATGPLGVGAAVGLGAICLM